MPSSDTGLEYSLLYLTLCVLREKMKGIPRPCSKVFSASGRGWEQQLLIAKQDVSTVRALLHHASDELSMTEGTQENVSDTCLSNLTWIGVPYGVRAY